MDAGPAGSHRVVESGAPLVETGATRVAGMILWKVGLPEGGAVQDVVERILTGLRRDEFFLAALATVGADGAPCVRYVRGKIDEVLTIRCPTFLDTNKVRQIEAHPGVALTCGDTDPSRPGTYFEIKGEARISTDSGDRRRVWGKPQQKWFSGPDDPNFAVVVIRPASIEALPIGGGPDAQVWHA